jgi:hypothetical protein
MTPFGENRGGTPMGERPLQRASRTQKVRRIRISVVRRSAFLFFLRFHFVAQSIDREGASDHRRHSLTKIGAESEANSYGSTNNSDADASRD